MQKITFCPACEKIVTLFRTDSGFQRCNNCWHTLSDSEVTKAAALAVELQKIEEMRNAALAKNR